MVYTHEPGHRTAHHPPEALWRVDHNEGRRGPRGDGWWYWKEKRRTEEEYDLQTKKKRRSDDLENLLHIMVWARLLGKKNYRKIIKIDREKLY